MEHKKLYHGTASMFKICLENGIDIEKCALFSDFGRGFYTTPSYKLVKEFAKNQAKRRNMYSNYKTKTYPMVAEYDLNIDELSKLKSFKFDNSGMKWMEFVYNNRVGEEKVISSFHNYNKDYDWVSGAIADSDMGLIIRLIQNGKMCFEDFCKEIVALDKSTPIQVSFNTEEAIQCLHLNSLRII